MTTEIIKYIRCPECGWIGELNECEVCGAEEGNVFCGTPRSSGVRYWSGVPEEPDDSPRTPGGGCTAEISIAGNLFVPGSTDETQ